MAERTAEIDRARDAMARGSWVDAYEGLSRVDPTELTARDLEAMADAAWWVSRLDESIAARQKAYAGYAAAAEDAAAGYVAACLCIEYRDHRRRASRARRRVPPRDARGAVRDPGCERVDRRSVAQPLGLAPPVHPARYDGLPGRRFPAPSFSFPTKEVR